MSASVTPGPSLEYLEAVDQSVRVIERFLTRDGDRPGLRPGDDRQVLAHNLTADPHRFKVSKGAFESRSGDVVVWGFENTGLYEDVGVYEHQAR